MSRPGRINLHNSLESKYNDPKVFTDNFLMKFRNKENKELNKFTASQFLEVWNHFDVDNNGYIESGELDNFLMQLVTSVLNDPIGSEVLSQTAYQTMKFQFLDAYDENEDGRIEIGELSQILPTDEEFLVLFQRENPLPSSVEFMKIWKLFDKDQSGFIECNELQDFVTYLLRKYGKMGENIEDSQIIYYSNIIMKLFDRNNDGKLQLSEMARLLPMKENYLAKSLFNNNQKISSFDLNRIFSAYDEDCNGLMDSKEMQSLLVDLLELSGENYDENRIAKLLEIILSEWDINQDGKINKKELKMILNQHSKLGMTINKPYNRIILNTNVKNSI